MEKLSRYEWIEKYGGGVKGRRECLAFLNGESITRDQAIKAFAYTCCGFGIDGRMPCEISDCPLSLYCQFYALGKEKKKRAGSKE